MIVMLAARDVLPYVGSLMGVIGVVYAARRAGTSSDRAIEATRRTKQEELAQSVNAAESSGFTRAQQMIEAAATAQAATFQSTVASMQTQIESLQKQLDRQGIKLSEQEKQIETQHKQIGELQNGRDTDRRTYSRYIQKLLDLLEQHNIVYPVPPDFFENGT